MRFAILCATILLSFMGCDRGGDGSLSEISLLAEPCDAIEFEKVAKLESTSEVPLDHPNLMVGGSDFYLVNPVSRMSQFISYSSDGSVGAVLDRPGGGPREIEFASAMAVDSQGMIYVHDPGNARLVRLRKDLTISGSNPFDANVVYASMKTWNDDRLVFAASGYRIESPTDHHLVHVTDLTGAPLNSFKEFPAGSTDDHFVVLAGDPDGEHLWVDNPRGPRGRARPYHPRAAPSRLGSATPIIQPSGRT